MGSGSTKNSASGSECFGFKDYNSSARRIYNLVQCCSVCGNRLVLNDLHSAEWKMLQKYLIHCWRLGNVLSNASHLFFLTVLPSEVFWSLTFSSECSSQCVMELLIWVNEKHLTCYTLLHERLPGCGADRWYFGCWHRTPLWRRQRHFKLRAV